MAFQDDSHHSTRSCSFPDCHVFRVSTHIVCFEMTVYQNAILDYEVLGCGKVLVPTLLFPTLPQFSDWTRLHLYRDGLTLVQIGGGIHQVIQKVKAALRFR